MHKAMGSISRIRGRGGREERHRERQTDIWLQIMNNQWDKVECCIRWVAQDGKLESSTEAKGKGLSRVKG
jgi:hypothetical protein